MEAIRKYFPRIILALACIYSVCYILFFRDFAYIHYDFRFSFVCMLFALPIISCAIGMFIASKILHATSLLNIRHKNILKGIIWLVVIVLYIALFLLKSNFSQAKPLLSGPLAQSTFDVVVYTIEHGGLVVGLLYGTLANNSGNKNAE
ncbi:hypothetical protein ACUYFE_07420 [Olegusella massiliensis]|uniref:hypothetical protein n=1 Tax=Olegusella massiliensis TaxID=1776381 RepID=UPI0040554258